MSGNGELELVPEMLSAYLDGELSAPERAAVEARLAESAEWRAELDEVRAARATRCAGSRHARPPTASGTRCSRRVASDDDTSGPVEGTAPIVSIESRRPRRRVAWIAAAAAIVLGLVAVDRGAAPQRGHPQRHRGGRAARRAGIRLR